MGLNLAYNLVGISYAAYSDEFKAEQDVPIHICIEKSRSHSTMLSVESDESVPGKTMDECLALIDELTIQGWAVKADYEKKTCQCWTWVLFR